MRCVLVVYKLYGYWERTCAAVGVWMLNPVARKFKLSTVQYSTVYQVEHKRVRGTADAAARCSRAAGRERPT